MTRTNRTPVLVLVALSAFLLVPSVANAWKRVPLRQGLAEQAVAYEMNQRFQYSYRNRDTGWIECRHAGSNVQRCAPDWVGPFVLGNRKRLVGFTGAVRVASYYSRNRDLRLLVVRFVVHRRCIYAPDCDKRIRDAVVLYVAP